MGTLEIIEIIMSACILVGSMLGIGQGVWYYVKRDDEKQQAKIKIANKQDYYMPRVMICYAGLFLCAGLFLPLIYWGLLLPSLKGNDVNVAFPFLAMLALSFLVFLYGRAMNRWARKPKDEREDEERKNRE